VRKQFKFMVRAWLCATICLLWLGVPATAQQPTIITFDVPGAGTATGQGTLPIGIVQGNWISGAYIDGNNVYHGFLRTPWGMFIKFDAPGAGTNPYQGTIEVHGMNQSLEIVGSVQDENNRYHGFVRSPSGKFTTFDCPGAGTGSYQGTAVHSLNAAGLILAEYLDSNNVFHGCIRDRDGNMTVYDPPDAGNVPGSYQGTYPAIFSGITPEGAIIGEYIDANNLYYAYLRAADGTITEFHDLNGGTSAYQGSGASGINPAGEINGWYIDANNVFHGYLRSPKGVMTEVDVPGSGTGLYQGTYAAAFMPAFGGINPAGTIVGFYADANSVYHGFLSTAHAKFVTFDVTEAGTGNWQGTLPLNITPDGAVTGWYIDGNGVYHGFLRMP
jgi:hypothetical protein